MRYKKGSISALFIAVALVSAFAQAREQSALMPERWQDVLDAKDIERIERSADRVADSIFHAIDDITLFETDGDGFSTEVAIHRRVFDNENIMNTWTVADRFTVQGRVPLVAETPGTGLDFWIGANAGIEVLNIRQVSPAQAKAMPSPEARKQQIVGANWYHDFSKNNQLKDGQWVYRLNEGGNKVLSFMRRDPEHNARYSDFPGMVVLPVKLPLSVESFGRMQEGEVLSYVGQGSVELGSSVGWNADPSGITAVAEMGASYTTYLRGSFRISVLKESESVARVKVTRGETLGHRASLGSNAKPTMLDGVIILKNLQRQLKIVPFEFSIGDSTGRTFDVGYKFDLSTAEGKEAYEKAVVGRFGMADELARENSKVVQKVFTRNAKTGETSESAMLRLGFIFKNQSKATFSNMDAVVTFPDGTRRVLTSASQSDRGWRLFWGVYEKFMNRFSVDLDLDKLENGEADKAMHLTVEGKIDDSDTDNREYLAYVLETEDAVGKAGIFDRVPEKEKINLGRSSFYYRVAMNHDQIQKFISVPKEHMWTALEKAFGVAPGLWSNLPARFGYRLSTLPLEALNVPLYVAGLNIRQGSKLWHAEKIRRRWAKLKNLQDPKRQAEALGEMFFDRLFGYELARLVRQVLSGEQVTYHVSGGARSVRRVSDQGGTLLTEDDIASRMQSEIEFDRQGPSAPDKAPGAQVSDFDVSLLDSDRVQIRFRLQAQPRALFFELSSKRWWKPLANETLAAILIPNAGDFSTGENTVIVDRRDARSVWAPIAAQLKPGDRYNLRMAINVDGLHWGQVAEKTFRTLSEE